MESTKGLFTHADVQRIIEKRGIDVNTLPTQAEIEHRFYERSMAALNRKKARAIIATQSSPETFRLSLRSINGSLKCRRICRNQEIWEIGHTSWQNKCKKRLKT